MTDDLLRRQRTNRLWLLRPVEGLDRHDDPWWGVHDMNHGFVICADTELRARVLASQQGGDENRKGFSPWIHEKYATCEELTPGDEGVIISDFHAG